MIQQIKSGLDDAASVIRFGAGGYVCIAIIDHRSQLPVGCAVGPAQGWDPKSIQKTFGRSAGNNSSSPLNWPTRAARGFFPRRWLTPDATGHGHFGSSLWRVRLEEQLFRSGRVSSASEATIRRQRSTHWTMGRLRRRCFLASAGMTSSSTFDAIFVGAGHNALIAAS
jgi:hypothetical protein